jgi:DNA-directed RNA polymerase sigma subunit (sigma70/sigma32)
VIELRMGFAGDRPHRLSEIAERLGLTKARARRVEQQALDRLRGVCPQSALDQLST